MSCRLIWVFRASCDRRVQPAGRHGGGTRVDIEETLPMVYLGVGLIYP